MGEVVSCVHKARKHVHMCVCMCMCPRAAASRAEQRPGLAGAGWMLCGWLQEGESWLGK